MAANYIPRPDGDFDSWLQNFFTLVSGDESGYGLNAGDTSQLSGLKLFWDTAFPDNIAKQAAAAAAVQAKNDARGNVETEVRSLVRRIQASPIVTDEKKQAAVITVPDTTPTPTGPPTSAPVIFDVDTAQRLQHTVHFRDQATPDSRAKPAGVRGCEIWVKVGDPAPASESELAFETLDTRTPHTISFDPSDGGQTVHYWLRWVSTRGETGPWSAPVSATVGA
jgi:hypothetical protein